MVPKGVMWLKRALGIEIKCVQRIEIVAAHDAFTTVQVDYVLDPYDAEQVALTIATTKFVLVPEEDEVSE